MANKKVIRKKLQGGDFTQIPLSILKDRRLSGIEFRLLVSILSDSDSFDLIQSNYVNRHGHDKNTISNAIDKLEKYGYLRVKRDKNNNPVFYTISEFGNLNNDSKTNNDGDEWIDFNSEESLVVLSEFVDYLEGEELEEKINSFTNDDTGMVNIEAAKKSLAELKKKKQDETYFEGMRFSSKDRDANRTRWSRKAVDAFEEWLKEEIYAKGNILIKNQMRSQWLTFNLRHSKVRQDFETQAIGD